MFRMYARNSHSYSYLILAPGIVREPTVWVYITSKYPGIHDMAGLVTRPPSSSDELLEHAHCSSCLHFHCVPEHVSACRDPSTGW